MSAREHDDSVAPGLAEVLAGVTTEIDDREIDEVVGYIGELIPRGAEDEQG